MTKHNKPSTLDVVDLIVPQISPSNNLHMPPVFQSIEQPLHQVSTSIHSNTNFFHNQVSN